MARGTSLALLLWQTKHPLATCAIYPRNGPPDACGEMCAGVYSQVHLRLPNLRYWLPIMAIVTLRWEEEERRG